MERNPTIPAKPNDYSGTASRVVVLQSLRGLATVSPHPEQHVDFQGTVTETGVTFSFSVRTVGGGQGRLSSRIKGFDVRTLHIHRRALLRRRGEQGELAGVVLRVTVPVVSLWLWVPWQALGDNSETIEWGDERLVLLGSLDGLIDFAAVLTPPKDEEENAGTNNA